MSLFTSLIWSFPVRSYGKTNRRYQAGLLFTSGHHPSLSLSRIGEKIKYLNRNLNLPAVGRLLSTNERAGELGRRPARASSKSEENKSTMKRTRHDILCPANCRKMWVLVRSKLERKVYWEKMITTKCCNCAFQNPMIYLSNLDYQLFCFNLFLKGL